MRLLWVCRLWRLMQSPNYALLFYNTHNNTTQAPKPADNLAMNTFIMLAIANVSIDFIAAVVVVVVGATAGGIPIESVACNRQAGPQLRALKNPYNRKNYSK